jgi:molybdenum cofactor guanylyltransferase
MARRKCENIMTNISGYVLAGGGSTRFGEDKARVIFDGWPMLSRTAELVSAVTGSVRVVAPPGRYEDLGWPVIADRWPGEGPLGGILTALYTTLQLERDAGCEWNLILGCDMPFLTGEFLEFLSESALASEARAIVPQSAQGREPLCACWRTEAADEVRLAFAGGMRKVNDALQHLRAEVLDEPRWKRFDSAGRLFWNMNTAAEYLEAQRIIETERS